MNLRIIVLLLTALLLSTTLWTAEGVLTPAPTLYAQEGFSCTDVTQIPQSECEALIAIYDANPASDFGNWLTTNTPCNWDSVGCSDGRVTSLELFVSSLPSEIGNLDALSNLFIEGEDLFSLPTEIGTLINLDRLEIAATSISALPTTIGSFTSLTELIVIDNPSLTELPSELGGLSSLLILQAEDNSLQSLPPEIGDLAALQILRLGSNSLADLPSEIGNLTALEILELYENNLTSLPPEIGDLTNLWELNLSENNLTSLPVEMGNLSSLQLLYVSGNPLTIQPIYINLKVLGNGVVERDIPGPFYATDTEVQLTAVPDSGWRFERWKGVPDLGVQATQPQIVITMGNNNASYSAVFENELSPTECGPLEQEAESGTLAGAFIADSQVDASGGQYIHVPRFTTPNVWTGPNGVSYASYCVTITETGLYRINATTASTDNGSNSFYVQVDVQGDGQPAEAYIWHTPIDNSFGNSYVNDSGRVNPVELALTPGNYTVLFSLRETGTQLDKFAFERVDVEPPVACGSGQQEAEDGQLSGFVVGNDSNASGGRYIYFDGGNGEYNGPNSFRKAEYCFTVPEDGIYVIKAMVRGIDGGSNSFYVRVDGSPTAGHIWHIPVNENYVSNYVNHEGNANPIEVSLTAGEHIVTVYPRERNARLDTIGLEQQDAPPEPVTCGPLQQEAEAGALSGGFVVRADEAASGGQYVHVAPGSGDEYEGPNQMRKAEYCFNVDKAGDYVIRTNVYGADNSYNSFYARVNGAPAAGYKWHTLINTDYAEDYVSGPNADPVVVSLQPGDHTVTIYVREAGTRLDTIGLELYDQATVRASHSAPQATAELYGHIQLAPSPSGAIINPDTVDFSQFAMQLVDAAGTQHRTIVDADGTYHIDELPAADYLLTLIVPDGATSLMPASVPISMRGQQVRRVVPDVVMLDNMHYIYLPMIQE